MDSGSNSPAASPTKDTGSKRPEACSSTVSQLMSTDEAMSVDGVRHGRKRKASPEQIGIDLLESKRARASVLDVFHKMVKDLEYQHAFERNNLARKIIMGMEQLPLEEMSSMVEYEYGLMSNSGLCYQPLRKGEYGANNKFALNGSEKNVGFEVPPASQSSVLLENSSVDIQGLEKTSARSEAMSSMKNYETSLVGVTSITGQSDLGKAKSGEFELLCSTVNQSTSNGIQALSFMEETNSGSSRPNLKRKAISMGETSKRRNTSIGPGNNMNPGVAKGQWTEEETQMVTMINEHDKKLHDGTKEKWMEIVNALPGTNGKHDCKEKWNNHLNLDNKIIRAGSSVTAYNNHEVTKGQWTEEETQMATMVNEDDKKLHDGTKEKWMEILNALPGTNAKHECKEKWNNHLNPDKKIRAGSSVTAYDNHEVIKGHWTEEESQLLRKMVNQHEKKQEDKEKWMEIAKALPGRNAKQCKERWNNHLNPKIAKDVFSLDEEKTLIAAHMELGHKWAEISRTRMPGRAENTIKNRWNAAYRKVFERLKPPVSLLERYIRDLGPRPNVRPSATKASQKSPAPAELTYTDANSPTLLADTRINGNTVPQPLLLASTSQSELSLQEKETYAMANQQPEPEPVPDIQTPPTCVALTHNYTSKDTEFLEALPPPSIPSTSPVMTCSAIAVQAPALANETRQSCVGDYSGCVDLTDNCSSELFDDLESLLELDPPPSLTSQLETCCVMPGQSSASFCTDPVQIEGYLQPNSMPATSSQSELYWKSYVDDWLQKDGNECSAMDNEMAESAPDIEQPPTCTVDYSSCVLLTDNYFSNEEMVFLEETNRFFEVHPPPSLLSRSPVDTCTAIPNQAPAAPITCSATSSQSEIIARSHIDDWLHSDGNGYSALPGQVEDHSLIPLPAPAPEMHYTSFDHGNEHRMDALTEYMKEGNNLSLDDMTEEELQRLALCFEV